MSVKMPPEFAGLNSPLIFIDTNVLLDFYRAKNSTGLSLLKKLDNAHGKIVTTYQVEMEFKKNRQAVFAEGMKTIKLDSTMSAPPAYLKGHRSFESAKKEFNSVKEKLQRVRESHSLALSNPTSHDKVYQSCQRLFKSRQPHCMSRDSEERRRIKKLALKRFALGYPPRKNNDTSIGDAINWEWIVHVGKENSCDFVIVSRDSDYGLLLDKQAYINDWLKQEYKDRVGKNRKIVLTQHLTSALAIVDQEITTDEQQAEDQLIDLNTASRTKASDFISESDNERLEAYFKSPEGQAKLGQLQQRLSDASRWFHDLSSLNLPDVLPRSDVE